MSDHDALNCFSLTLKVKTLTFAIRPTFRSCGCFPQARLRAVRLHPHSPLDRKSYLRLESLKLYSCSICSVQSEILVKAAAAVSLWQALVAGLLAVGPHVVLVARGVAVACRSRHTNSQTSTGVRQAAKYTLRIVGLWVTQNACIFSCAATLHVIMFIFFVCVPSKSWTYKTHLI